MYTIAADFWLERMCIYFLQSINYCKSLTLLLFIATYLVYPLKMFMCRDTIGFLTVRADV